MAQELTFSDDQAAAFGRIREVLSGAGVDIAGGTLSERSDEKSRTLAVIGKAGSGKTMLLAELTRALSALGVETVSAEYESRKLRDKRTLAVLAPTNKAASVLRHRGVPATTIHRILYSPVYDPEFERVAEWLMGEAARPEEGALTALQLDRAEAFFKTQKSIPGALAAAGLRGSDFITGWKRRDQPLDIGFIDEASMLDERALADLQEIFATLILFGDPAQLAPVGTDGEMIFERLKEDQRLELSRIHRQSADNPILDLAHALADPLLEFHDFEEEINRIAREDDRVTVAQRVDAQMMARAPVLVWRNATRIRLIQAFRAAHGCPPDLLLPGEPLICDGIELPLKHRKKRIDLETRGLIKGAQVVYLGEGRKPGFARLHILGAEAPQINAASIIKIELPGEEEPLIASAASMGAIFVHGAACTIHKGQGSQWPEVQVFAPDLYAAARSGREESGVALWKRLAYVAITRVEHRLHWVTRYMLARPTEPLGTEDLAAPEQTLTLETQSEGD